MGKTPRGELGLDTFSVSLVHLNCRALSGTCPTRGSQRICPSVLGLRAAGLLSLWAGPSVWDSLPEGTGQVRGPPPEQVLGPRDQPPPRLLQQGRKSPKQDDRRLCPAGWLSRLCSGPVCNYKPRGARAGRAEACKKQPWAQARGQLAGVMALGCGEQS